ncbi:beta-galactosidase [Pedococcus sp. 5OH_020]|uniref:beta-galactosidase n=1 Tax=Pedococcus sp. 5OH_020 TaxID=2989814 RepID=UPI0022E9A8DA|nr:beta-galactosidase [Pedococcus sp. 5OH_020]
MRPWPSGRVAFGGDYNPEQWPREVWLEDMELMRRAGVSFVTLGVFSWSWLEPAKGEYEFAWLDDVMGLLHENEIAVDLATATATPPPWLSAAHPELLPVDRQGHTLWPGSRQTWCPSSVTYRDYALALTTQLAQRYHDHPALAMWHVSNEYGCHNIPCYCDRCGAGFRRWLEQRYGSVDALNEAWGTAFWSQRYTAWDQVLPPRLTTTFANPTHELDYRRYQSDVLLDFFRAEKAVLTELSPGVPVTTNFMTLRHFDKLDYHQWAADQDVVSTDHYIVNTLQHPRAELAFSGDLTRGLAGGRPWLLMEHSTSAVNWQPVNPAKDPGQTLRDSLAHVARGADTVGFFQWRQSRSGSEKFHSALVPHAGADSARFREVCELGAVAARLGEVCGSRVEADVAILWDYQARWAASGPAMPSSLLDYAAVPHTLHRLLRERGITADVVHPSADLAGYRLVVVPTLYLVTDEDAGSIAAAAHAGAQVVVTFFSGISTQDDHVRLGGYPGAFRDLLGLRVEELFPLMPQAQVAVGDGWGTLWSEDVTAVDCEVLETYTSGPLAGRPAVTRRATGEGAAWYLSTLLDDEALGGLLDRVTAAAQVTAPAQVPSRVEVTRRSGQNGSWLFLVNDSGDPQQVAVTGYDLVSDGRVGPTVKLAPGAVAVVREE